MREKKRRGEIGFYFFFSSRRRHTRYWRDWSSDVCSSDLRLRVLDGALVPLDRLVVASLPVADAGEPELELRARLERCLLVVDLIQEGEASLQPRDRVVVEALALGEHPELHHQPGGRQRVVAAELVRAAVRPLGPLVASKTLGDVSEQLRHAC